VLAGVPKQAPDPNVLVGNDDWDDAGVYRVSDDLALVQTVDFFTPVVDDPRDFGAIAAVNALSDVYAMGGVPKTALAIVCFPHKQLPIEVLTDTLRGAHEVMTDADVRLLGGHSVKDPEFKIGFAVTGHVHPDRIVRNRGARVGDHLFLTKPIGTGILSTAVKRDRLDPETTAILVRTLRTLNRAGAQAMVGAGAHAATDVTGFGLLGHARGIARASGVTLRIRAADVPLLPRVRELFEAGVFPGGLNDNAQGLAPDVRTADPTAHRLFFDPQTAGGLLVSLDPAAGSRFQALLAQEGAPPAAVIGEVIAHGAHWVEVI
jgi:selenide, water dikinase